ncbi:MAG: Asp-tRNA(Asn)/Glu-tRNA(Gln) amidotransferase subunit GatC [Lentisphaerae bacterium]|nr:Asp-tRNA(Asn)/Glu-tRNA(Gln) amidotransferase subunit GatC [Lentisphaerota bacterium]
MSKTSENACSIDVKYVARLARLNLGEDEALRLQAQMDQIIRYIGKINELDLSGIEPASHASSVINVFRKDDVKASIDRDRILANAPKVAKDMFLVPKIVD